jgi:hypothetical protein
MKILTRLPSRKQILPVFSLIVFIDFSWMLLQFFRQVPSWIFYLNIGKVLILFAYVVSFTLFESALLLSFLLALCIIFPVRHFRDKFTPQGGVQVALISLIALVLRQKIEVFQKFEIWILFAIPLISLIMITLSIIPISKILDRFRLVDRIVTALIERMTVFGFLYIPLGLLGLVIVILRNLFL